MKNLMIIAAMLFCFGCESSTGPLSVNTEATQAKSTEVVKLTVPKKYEIHEIKKWKGRGIKSTETFHVPDLGHDEWIIFWVSRLIHKSGGILQISIYKSDGTLVDTAANVMGNSNDSTVIRSGPGDYYLKINSANVVYVVAVCVIQEVK